MELQWPLIIFTSFIAWSMGTFASQSIAMLQGEAKKAQFPALIASFVIMCVGGIAVFFHLAKPLSIFNGFGNPTSGITQELIALVLVFIVMVIYFVMLRRSGDEVSVPKWVAIAAIVLCVVTDIVMAHSYMMPSRPAWNSVLQIGSILAASCASGPLTLMLIITLRGDEVAKSGKVAMIGTIVAVVLAIVYGIMLVTCSGSFASFQYYWDPTIPCEPMADVSASVESQYGLLWGGAVLLGGVVPAITAFLAWKKNEVAMWKVMSIVGLICAIAGAIILRVVFYNLGICFFTSF